MKKLLFIGALTLASSTIIYFDFVAGQAVDQSALYKSDGSMASDGMLELAKNNPPAPTPEEEVKNQPQVNEKKPSQDSGSIIGTLAEAEVVRKWELERGYLGKDSQKLEEYKKYDHSTLKIMVDSGDVLAQAEVIKRSYGDARTKEIFKALAMGSTSVVMVLGMDVISRYEGARDSNDRHKLIKEVFAIYEMGALRGDRYNQIVLQNEFIKKHNIKLTADDKKEIKQRGKELYDEIQQLRFELGLDEFDNSVPMEVSNYYNNLYKFTYEGAFRD